MTAKYQRKKLHILSIKACSLQRNQDPKQVCRSSLLWDSTSDCHQTRTTKIGILHCPCTFEYILPRRPLHESHWNFCLCKPVHILCTQFLCRSGWDAYIATATYHLFHQESCRQTLSHHSHLLMLNCPCDIPGFLAHTLLSCKINPPCIWHLFT